VDLLEGTERWEASPHQARQSAEGLNEMSWEIMAGRSGLNPLPGSTAGCGKPHVRWCGRVTARNHRDPTRSDVKRVSKGRFQPAIGTVFMSVLRTVTASNACALSVLSVRVAEELSVFCPKTGFPTLPWTPRWWSRSSMPGLRAPIHLQVAKKSEVAYGEPLNGSPPESLLYALCLAK
jgi:hypothetical protein